MLRFLFGSTSGSYSGFEWSLEIICDLALLLNLLLVVYLNVSAIKTSRKIFIKEYWTSLDVFDKCIMTIFIIPAWIYHFVKFLFGKRKIRLEKFKTKY